ncbi:MAG: 50S ribosomal protein L18e [Nitrososphaeria archaeon]
MRKKSEKPILKETIDVLKKVGKEGDNPIWSAVLKKISSSRSRVPVVNVGKVSKLTKKNDVVLVPGKLLGGGLIDHSVKVGALSASRSAVEKITAAGGSVTSLIDLVEQNPEGSGIIVIGG